MRRTHCGRGHLLAGRNVYERPDGKRECKTCRRDYMRVYMRTLRRNRRLRVRNV